MAGETGFKPRRFGSAFAAARAPAGNTVDANSPATAALAVWMTSPRVPSKPGREAMLRVGLLDEATTACCRPRDAVPVKASLNANAQSTSNDSKAWERIEDKCRGNEAGA